jgi:hypothetical protein
MDGVFGGADMSHVEDLGVASKQAQKLDEDLEEVEAVHASKA